MSRPFKLSLITAAVLAVAVIVIDVATGSRSVGAEVGLGLVVFAIVFLIAFIIFRLVGGKSGGEEYDYEDD